MPHRPHQRRHLQREKARLGGLRPRGIPSCCPPVATVPRMCSPGAKEVLQEVHLVGDEVVPHATVLLPMRAARTRSPAQVMGPLGIHAATADAVEVDEESEGGGEALREENGAVGGRAAVGYQGEEELEDELGLGVGRASGGEEGQQLREEGGQLRLPVGRSRQRRLPLRRQRLVLHELSQLRGERRYAGEQGGALGVGGPEAEREAGRRKRRGRREREAARGHGGRWRERGERWCRG